MHTMEGTEGHEPQLYMTDSVIRVGSETYPKYS